MARKKNRPAPEAYLIEERAPAEMTDGTMHVRASGGRARLAARARNRILMCAVLFVFAFSGLALRMAFITFGQIEPVARHAGAINAAAPRPEIVDRNGALLATDLPLTALEVWGRDVWDAGETAAALARVLPDIDVLALTQKLNAGQYVEVAPDLSPSERQAIFELGLEGVRFASRTRRFYPQADLAAHVIGHGEPGKGGVMGLEKAVSDGRVIIADGGPARATLDIRVQQVLEDELALGMEKYHAKAAWGGIMDVETGEVIALASLPDFDPNAPGAAPADFRRNRAVYDRYELGSAFKAFTAAAALETGVASEFSTYDARGRIQVADWSISDYHGENRELTFSEVVQHSSNIGMVRVVQDLGVDNQKKFLKKLGLLDPLPISLAENRAPGLPWQWGPVESATISYGHGISVTPLHLLAAYVAVVNGGAWRAPVFAKGTPEKVEPVFSKKTSAIMRRILREVIIDGTAGQADVPGYFPIGKTATAEKPSPRGGYDRTRLISSFIGAVPGYAPRYVILVSFDEPQGIPETHGFKTAGWNAAPVFASVVARAAPLLGVSKTSEELANAAFGIGEFAGAREARNDTETARQ